MIKDPDFTAITVENDGTIEMTKLIDGIQKKVISLINNKVCITDGPIEELGKKLSA